MTHIAQLGCGRMGSALARTFAQAGHEVVAWNRTPEQARALAGPRIESTEDVAHALAATDLAVICIDSYEHIREVLAEAGELRGRTLVNFVGGPPEEAHALAAWAQERGLEILEGELMVYPQGVGADDARVIYSGNRPVWERFESTLRVLGGETVYVSDDPGAVCILQSASVGIFYCTALAGFLEAAEYAHAHGVDPALLLPGIDSLLDVLREACGEGAEAFATDDFASDQASVDLYRGATSRAMAAMNRVGLRGPMVATLARELAAASEAGHGRLGFFALSKTAGLAHGDDPAAPASRPA